MLKVSKVDKNGIGYNFGIASGDELVAIDGRPIADILDFEYFSILFPFLKTDITPYESWQVYYYSIGNGSESGDHSRKSHGRFILAAAR